MNRNKTIKYAILFLSLSLFFMGNAVYASAEKNDNTICQGVFIDEVDVSGMDKDEAETAVEDFREILRNKGVAVKVHNDFVYSTMGDLGYNFEANDSVDQALALGKSGNLIKRYKDIKDIEQGSVVLPLAFSFDESKIKELVSVDVSAYNIAPVNATVKRQNGEFIYADHVVGSKVNVKKTVKLISEAMTNWNRQDIMIDAVVEEDMPKYTKDNVEKCNTIIGTFTTEYTTSAQGRAANLANGARLIDNTVLYPGDVFNAYNVLTPFTEENGYYVAGAYLNGVVVDSVGGGACQVTTTLYNAVLEAELEVVERFPHSMTISYVDLSRDAAIAGTYKNFQFKNNTENPILIEATTKDRRITFKIWGNEIRDTANRKIEYVSEVLSKTNPPADVITKDPSQPTTYRKVTQTAHTGYKAKLWKVVYENGVEVSRTLVNSSNYSAAPQYVTVGSKKPKPATKKTDTADSDAKTSTDNKQNTANSQSVTTNRQSETDNQAERAIEANTEDQVTSEDQVDGWNPAWDAEESVEE